jgi:lipid-A-disaccharide synthase
MAQALCIMLVAAEASGDALGGGLMRALRRRLGPGLRFVGVGGALMQAEGLDSPFDIGELSVLGWIEGLSAYRRVVARADQTAALAAREQPDAAILIDSWGFTMRVAQRLRRHDPKLLLIKYVGPQVWASRPGRARILARTFDHLLSILAFDAPYFEREGLPVTLVGNPTLARSMDGADPERLRRHIGAAPDDPILLVLPGSRPSEIARLMPPFGQAVALLKQSHPRLQVVLGVAPSVAEAVRAQAAAWAHPPRLLDGEDLKLDAMRAATVALACSGTVTTELAIAGCPMVVAYRVGNLSAVLIRALIKTPYATLLNIAAGRPVVPELIQQACTGPALARQIAVWLDDPRLRAEQIAAQNVALELMGPRDGPDPSERAAEAVVGLLQSRGLAP